MNASNQAPKEDSHNLSSPKHDHEQFCGISASDICAQINQDNQLSIVLQQDFQYVPQNIAQSDSIISPDSESRPENVLSDNQSQKRSESAHLEKDDGVYSSKSSNKLNKSIKQEINLT